MLNLSVTAMIHDDAAAASTSVGTEALNYLGQ